jgi:phage tail-like protein
MALSSEFRRRRFFRSVLLTLAIGMAAAASALAGQTVGLVADRYALLSADGKEIASFTELGSIISEVSVPATSGNGQNGQNGKLAKNFSVTLRRGKTNGLEMWAWHEQAVLADIAGARRSVSLVMFNTDGKPVARYLLEHAWPSKLEIGALKAGSSEVLMETVTIVCERIQRVAV